METSTQGFWQSMGEQSIVDWCEPNYTVSFYVAEWWNTLSSVPLALTGMIGLALCWHHRKWVEGRFFANFVAFAVIGWGSVAFHGTLLRIPQALDEIPMVFSAMISAYILVLRKDFLQDNGPSRRRLWGWGLVALAIAFTLTYMTTQTWYFLFFLFMYASFVTYVTLRTFYLSYTAPNKAQMVKLAWVSFGLYLGGLFFMWIPEHVIFPCDHPFQLIQPHSWFHTAAMMGSYVWIQWAIADRLTLKGLTPEFRWLPFPFMVPKEGPDAAG